MRKIVPFNNVLNFSTDVCEITAISLEHDIKIDSDSIGGVFFISGEYKITDGQLEKEKFNFELPFDIALGKEYETDTLVVDIDDFRYELLDRNKLKVNIELYIDGEEKIESGDVLEENEEKVLEEKQESEDELVPIGIDIEELDEVANRRDDEKMDNDTGLLDEMLNDNKEEIEFENENLNLNTNNIFNNFTDEEKYVTYRVYRVVDGDNIDKIMDKYKVTKEELEKYNNTLNIRSGDKLIIPYNDK